MGDYRELYAGWDTLDGLLDDVMGKWNEQSKAFKRNWQTDDADERAKAIEQTKKAGEALAQLNPLMSRIGALANYQDIRLRFSVNRWLDRGLGLACCRGSRHVRAGRRNGQAR